MGFRAWSDKQAGGRVPVPVLLLIGVAGLGLLPTPGRGECGPIAIKQLTHSTDVFSSNNSLPRPDRTGRKLAYSLLFSGGSGPVYRLDSASGAGEYLGDSGNYYPYPSINDSGDKVVSGGEGDPVPESYYRLAAVYLDDFTQPAGSRRRVIAGGSNYSNAIAGEISGDGNRIGLISYGSNKNGYTWGYQIFLYDMPGQSWSAVGPGLSMPYYYSTLRPLLTLNGDGSRMAFVAAFDPAGQNADGNFELFVYQLAGNGLTQITHTTGGDLQFQLGDTWPANSQQSINTSGTRLAFISNRDYTGENSNGDYEVFLYDTETERFTQLTFGTGGDLITRSGNVVTYFSPALAAPAIDGAGDRVVFASRYDLLGTNPDQNWEIYMWDATGAVPRLVQVTNSINNPSAPYGGAANSDPWISRNGNVVVFSSYSDLTGENAAGKREIFSADLCPAPAARCGDGTVDTGEQCDSGADNSDIEPNTCRTDCTLPRCGDNVVDDGDPYYEDCDDGNTVDGDDCPANCKLPMVLTPRLILGKGLCEDQPQKIELREGGTNRNITSDPDIEYEWVHSYLETTVLNAILNQVKDYLKEKMEIKVPDLQTANIEVDHDTGEVRFIAGDAAIGLNLIRAKRKSDPNIVSNRALVISGLRLIQAGSLKIEPTSIANAVVGVVSEALTWALGKDMPNAPMILFSQGPCDDRLSFIGRTGKVMVKSLKFDLLGGLIKDVDLLGGIEKAVGLIPGTQPLIKWAKITGVAVAGELLDFEVSSEAAKSSEKDSKSPPVTSDAVIEVTDSFSRKFPFFHGFVSAKAPGLSAVQATLDLGKCLGKASDNMIVWVAPSLTKLDVRNENGIPEDPLYVPFNGNRTAHAVGMLTAFQQGTQPIDISFDPIGMSLSDIKKFIEEWIPGGKKLTKAAEVPINLAYPRNVTLASDGTYKGGNNYFGLKFSYNPLLSKITINDLRLQTAIPNLPVVAKWTMPVPPNPPTPVASVDQSAGILTGQKAGNGQTQVEVCVPFLTNDYSSDINGVRVLDQEMAVEATVYADFNGNGTQDTWEPGLAGWTVEVLNSVTGGVITSGTTDGAGVFSTAVRQDQLPVGHTTFGLREVPQGGWTPTAPSSGSYAGIPISLNAVVSARFGNYQDLSVSGVTFADEDGNGTQDPGEIGLPGWTIEFVDSNGAVHQATTGGDGSYSFTAPFSQMNGTGSPLVREVLQAGWTPIFPPGGSQDLGSVEGAVEGGLNLVVNFANQPQITPGAPTPTPTRTPTATATFTATMSPTSTPTTTWTPTLSATPTSTATATRTPVAVIVGNKFHDRNGNGIQDAGEEAVAGWTMFLDDNRDGVLNNPVSGDGVCDAHATERCTVTDGNGNYGFALTATGVYTVREVSRHLWQQKSAPPPDLVVSHPGQSYAGISFGNQLEPARRGTGDCNTDDIITVDEILIGVNIALGNARISQCPPFDGNADGTVTVDEILTVVRYALDGLPPLPPTATITPAASLTPSATVTPSASLTPTPVLTPTRSFTPSPSPSPSPVAGGVSETVAGRAVLVANGMSAFPAVITALVSGLKYGGTAGALTAGDWVGLIEGIAAGNSCPAGGTATRTCGNTGGVLTANIVFGSCKVNTPSGTATIDGSMSVSGSSGSSSCTSLIFATPWTASANLTANFRTGAGASLMTVTANLTAGISPRPDFFGSCYVSGADLTQVNGTLATQFDSGGSVSVLFQNTGVSIAIDVFNSQCVPVNYAMTFNGPAQITSSSGTGGAASTAVEPLDVVFSAFVIRQDASGSPTQTWMDGGVSSPCFGGGITLQTTAPLTQTVGQACPTSGTVKITSPPGQPQILYLPGGLVGIDINLDGISENTLGSCFDALSPICQVLGGTPTATPTASSTATASETPTETGTVTPTFSFTPTETPSASPTVTRTGPPPPTLTTTPTRTWTLTPTRTWTATVAASLTPTRTSTASATPTQSGTRPPTPSPTATGTATFSATPTQTGTITPTPSITGTFTATPSPTRTLTPSRTATSTVTWTPSRTPTITRTPTRTSTATPTPSPTLAPKVYCSQTEMALIPDNSDAGINNDIVISDLGQISNLKVIVNISHSWVGDLMITLDHVGYSTPVTLLNRPGQSASFSNGCNQDDVSCTFDDAALAKADDQCWPSDPLPQPPQPPLAAIDGGFQPTGLLSRFNGQSPSGTWRLNVSDHFPGDVGSLLGWCLVPNTTAPRISSFTCNGASPCTLNLGQAASLAVNYTDASSNASHYRLAGYMWNETASAWTISWAMDGPITPPVGAGTLYFDMAPFACDVPPCGTSYWALDAIITDSTGLQSPPVEVRVTVLGTQ